MGFQVGVFLQLCTLKFCMSCLTAHTEQSAGLDSGRN